MTIDVKICGLKVEAPLLAALDAGAAYVGLVFYPRSPRNVDIETAIRLASIARGRAKVVAMLVDAGDTLIDDIATQIRPDLLQLHGHETPARVAAIRARTGIATMKAIAVRTPEDAAGALAYDGFADFILFDAKPSEGRADALPGGNGVAFDWRVLLGVRDQVRYMLSGGLTPENVADAIRRTGTRMVDVSSGVERVPGEKDPEKIRRFIEAAQSAA